MQLAPSAFLASAAANSNLTHHILPPRFQSSELLYIAEATKVWSTGLDLPHLSGPASHHQNAWDAIKVSAHGRHPPEAGPRCCDMLPPFGSLNKRVWCRAECPSCFIFGTAHGQQHRSCSVGLRLGSPFVASTPVTTVVCRLIALPHTDSAANEVRDVMLLSTTLSIAQCLQPISLPGLNQLDSPAPMANAPMESR